MPPATASVSLRRTDAMSVRRRLQAYHAHYAPFFGRRELRGHLHAYLQGLLSDEPRKLIERMVLRLRGGDAPLLAAHRELVAATLGEEEGVLAVDGTDIPKDGTESVGVARQYCG